MLRKKEINWLERQKGEEQRWKYIFGAVKTRKQELHEEIRRREGIMIDKCSRSISPNLTKAQEE